jgi:ketosteroid isomerase-like protein
MIDEIAIQQTISRYSEGATRQDWDQVLSTFTPDGIWEVPTLGGAMQGHAAIRERMMGFMTKMDYLLQTNSPALITVDGDKAKACTVIHESGKIAHQDTGLIILGRYEDDLVRTADGWKFAHRVFTMVGIHAFSLLPSPPL